MKKSFTLIELLIVLMIIGTMIVLAIPSMQVVVIKARGPEAKQMLNAFSNAVWQYYMESGNFPLIGDGVSHDAPSVLNVEIPSETKFFSYYYTYQANLYIAFYAFDREIAWNGGPNGAPYIYQITYRYNQTSWLGQPGQKVYENWYKYYTHTIVDEHEPTGNKKINGW